MHKHRLSLPAFLLAIAAFSAWATPALAITTTGDATTLANAALTSPSLLSSATWDQSADATATAVATENVAGFPADGSNYTVLTSGNAGNAFNAQSTLSSVNNHGGTRGGAMNVVALHLNLNVPTGNNCLSMTFRFFSEEYPQYVGQGYNDGFLAEMDPSSAWTMSNHQITAPQNFAFMPGGAFVSINSATMSAADAAGTVYGGGTQMLYASTPVTGGSHSLVLSVWDDGDVNLDSAAFIDGIHTWTAPSGGCVAGATETAPPDTTPPDTSITSGPSGTTSATAATFGFTATESGSTYECQLDSGSWTACTSTTAYTGLADGSHTFSVRATDSAGNVDPTPATRSWTVDTSVPDTSITSGPSGVVLSSTSATYGFDSTESGSTYECKLDSGSWTACTSTKTYTGLSEGEHTFSVRATDGAGNVDATPATHSWIVDTTAPDTSITSGPAASSPTSSTSATLGFSADEFPATYECKLDSGSWTSCTSTTTYTGLSDGSHTFSVRATDGVGNVDATPATRTWVVDTIAPDTMLTGGPSGTVSVTGATFIYTSNETATFECQLDGGPWAPCGDPSTVTLTGLSDGPHTFAARATDTAGNTDPTPATHSWTVDTTAPAAPVIDLTSAPAAISSDPSPTIQFSGEPGGTYECRIDGGPWVTCTSPWPLSSLTDGPHTFDVRQTDDAGNVSPVASHSWVLDTTGPDAPTIVTGPSGDWPSHDAQFGLAGEVGATIECRVDGGAWTLCPNSLDVDGLALGDHLLEARQTDTAGNVSPLASRHWNVVDPPAPASNPAPAGDDTPTDPAPGGDLRHDKPASIAKSMSGSVGARTTHAGQTPVAVLDGSPLPVGCTVHRGAMTSCSAMVWVGGHKVGTGRAQFRGGVSTGRVKVALNSALRHHKSTRAVVVFYAMTPGRKAPLMTRRVVSLVPQREWIMPSDGMFNTSSAVLLPRVLRYLHAIAPALRSAEVVRCEGHTDSQGGVASNMALGLRRAQAVCHELRSLGVTAKLLAVSRGESRPRATNSTATGRWLNRRVALRVLR